MWPASDRESRLWWTNMPAIASASTSARATVSTVPTSSSGPAHPAWGGWISITSSTDMTITSP
jgi:hypothetical protein